MSSITNNSGAYRVSNSEIQTFKDCRRKWWLAYDRKLKPKNVRFDSIEEILIGEVKYFRV
jgi:hypothetical protein